MTLVECTLPGDPHPKGRPRASLRGGNVHMRTPAATKAWEAKAAWLLRSASVGVALSGPVRLYVDAIKSRPSGGGYPSRQMDPEGLCWRARKPDLDNVVKAVADALEKAGIIRNDSQIADVQCRSLWAPRGAAGCVVVRLEIIDREGAP